MDIQTVKNGSAMSRVRRGCEHPLPKSWFDVVLHGGDPPSFIYSLLSYDLRYDVIC